MKDLRSMKQCWTYIDGTKDCNWDQMGASLALIWTNNRHATGPRKEARDHSQQVLACPTDFGPHSADSRQLDKIPRLIWTWVRSSNPCVSVSRLGLASLNYLDHACGKGFGSSPWRLTIYIYIYICKSKIFQVFGVLAGGLKVESLTICNVDQLRSSLFWHRPCKPKSSLSCPWRPGQTLCSPGL